MTTILITGGTGLIGKALGQALLDEGYHIIILTRQVDKKSQLTNTRYAHWDVEEQTIDKSAISDADYIIHLAGAGVADKRWTKKRKEEIVSSRVNSSKLIIDSLKTIPNKVKAVVCASAIGWYGEDPLVPHLHPFKESDIAAGDFLGTTCKKWEESIDPVTHLGKRLVKLRTGIVISNKGGALKEFEKPLRFGIAAILGSGKQIISWIHIHDLIKMYIAAIENEMMNGVYNAVAPQPVSSKSFTLQLAQIRKGRFFVPIYVPSFVLKLVLGEMSTEILKSATVSCQKMEATGFVFQFPALQPALTK